MAPIIGRPRPARRVEGGAEFDEKMRRVNVVKALKSNLIRPRVRSYSTRVAGRPGSRRGGTNPGFHPGLPMFDPRAAGRFQVGDSLLEIVDL